MKSINLVFFLCVITFVSCQSKDSKQEKTPSTQATKASEMKVDDKGLSHKAALLKTAHGNIIIKFYPKIAPNTVTRIVELISQGFYNGIIFHRVVPGFVIQAGDPSGTGRSGSGKNLKAEFSPLKHEPGTVAMARKNHDIDSADSQFYISMSSPSHLDGKYTIFGKVIKGMDVVEKVSEGDKILSFTMTDKY